MGRKQGLDNLLNVAQLIRNPRVKIVIAGDGNDRNRLIGRAKNLKLRNVSFLGLQPSGQFENMLQAADVLLLNQRNSVGEMNLPSKLASYFAAGKPVIGAVAAGSNASCEIEAAGGGILVPPADGNALVRAIEALMNSPERAADLGRRGSAYAQQYLTRESSLAGYDEFLGRLAHVPIRDATPEAIA
jgi:glycosyltransferase involved in cell wall biosynthesis